MRVVLDTNVIVSGVISPRSYPHQILRYWSQGKFIVVASEAIIAEVIRVLRYPRIQERYHLTEEDIKAVINLFANNSQIVEGLYEVQTSRDPDDNMFLACALEGGVDYVVSGDPHLREIKQYHSIQIISSQQLVKMLSTH